MAINLSKGQRVDIGLQKIGVGLGWDPSEAASGSEYDLDASAFMLGTDKQVPSEGFFVFYGMSNLTPDKKPISSDSAVTSSGDDRTGGSSEGDDFALFAAAQVNRDSDDEGNQERENFQEGNPTERSNSMVEHNCWCTAELTLLILALNSNHIIIPKGGIRVDSSKTQRFEMRCLGLFAISGRDCCSAYMRTVAGLRVGWKVRL